MNIKPVEHPVEPGYPDKYAEESRRALASAQPRRWIAAPLAAGLAATVALGLSGCGEHVVMGEMAIPTEVTINSGIPYSEEYLAKIAAANVIPLFEFGEGTGSIGCMSIAAPVFLSEEEAFAILSAAFAEAGVMLRRNNKTRQGTLPVTIIDTWDDKAPKTKKGSLKPDALAGDIPVEFVSREDVKAWEYEPTGPMRTTSSAGSYKMKDAAQALSENNPGLVVFYDPVTYWDITGQGERYEDFRFTNTEQEARAESEQLLREQVQAFIEWLQAEGEPS